MKTPAALAALAALAVTAGASSLDFAYRLPAEIQTPGPQALPELTWQQGATPLIRVDVLSRGRPVDADTNTTVRMIIGQTATNLYYVVASNSVTTGTSYYVQWPTVGTNSAGTNTTAQAWWYTIYFERAGHRYWTGNGSLYIEATTSTAEDGLDWQTITSGYAAWGTITGAITSQTDLVAALAGKAGTGDLASVSGMVDVVTGNLGSVSGMVDTAIANLAAVYNSFTNHQANGDADILHLTAAERATATNPPDLSAWSEYPATTNISWIVNVVTQVVTNLVVTNVVTNAVLPEEALGLYAQTTAVRYEKDGGDWYISGTVTPEVGTYWSLIGENLELEAIVWISDYNDDPYGIDYIADRNATGNVHVSLHSVVTNQATNTISLTATKGTNLVLSGGVFEPKEGILLDTLRTTWPTEYDDTDVTGAVAQLQADLGGLSNSAFIGATIVTGATPALVTNAGVLGITVPVSVGPTGATGATGATGEQGPAGPVTNQVVTYAGVVYTITNDPSAVGDVLYFDPATSNAYFGAAASGDASGWSSFDASQRVNFADQEQTNVAAIRCAAVVIGDGAESATHTTAVGFGAKVNDQSTAIGYNANAGDRGVAVGYSTKGGLRGVAVGYGTGGTNYGVAIGGLSVGDAYGAAVGYFTKAEYYGSALGYRANGTGTNIAIGAYSTAIGGPNRTAIGYQTTNDVDNSTRVRGDLYLDGTTSINMRATFGTGDFVAMTIQTNSWVYLDATTNLATNTIVFFGPPQP